MKTYIITTPFNVVLPRKTVKDKKAPISMNFYGNVNSFTNNEIKRIFKEIVRPQVEGLTINTPVEITYQVFKPSHRKLDKMNVIAVTSKYLLDAITELGCWEDDNDDHIKTETLLPTQYSKNDGKVMVTIKEI
jgi:Holliday junction resolvase RusA-like endonuclease